MNIDSVNSNQSLSIIESILYQVFLFLNIYYCWLLDINY